MNVTVGNEFVIVLGSTRFRRLKHRNGPLRTLKNAGFLLWAVLSLKLTELLNVTSQLKSIYRMLTAFTSTKSTTTTPRMSPVSITLLQKKVRLGATNSIRVVVARI